jgi:hypothetical protein
LTPERWTDLESLFGQNGAYGGCWCMFWRITRSRFAENGGAGNKAAMRQLVEQGEVPGVLTYRDGESGGWRSLGPRERYGALERTPVLRRGDERPEWSLGARREAARDQDAPVGKAHGTVMVAALEQIARGCPVSGLGIAKLGLGGVPCDLAAHDEDATLEQAGLAVRTHVVHDDVAGVPVELVGVEAGGCHR